MPRAVSGLNVVTRKAATGEVAERVFYDRATGARIGSSREGWTKEAALGVLREAARDAPAAALRPGSFGWLAASYLASPRFAKKAERTRAEYRDMIDRLRGAWEERDLSSFRRADVAAWLRDRAAAPWRANAEVRVLRLMWQWARRELDLEVANPAEAPELHSTPPRTAIWGGEAIDAFLDAAADDAAGDRLRIAFALLLFTIQRLGDVLAMTRAQVSDRDGRLWITLRQQKTGELVTIPCHRRLEVELRRVEGGAFLLVPSPTGRPWSRRNFSRAWDRAVDRANHRIARTTLRAWGGLPPPSEPKARAAAKVALRKRLLVGLQRRDLRRTGMVQLALAGATIPQIAALSGHSIDDTARIIETYIPRRGDVALVGVEAWEAGATRSVALLPGSGKG
jgi:integrase